MGLALGDEAVEGVASRAHGGRKGQPSLVCLPATRFDFGVQWEANGSVRGGCWQACPDRGRPAQVSLSSVRPMIDELRQAA